jgi:hypothetical protein
VETVRTEIYRGEYVRAGHDRKSLHPVDKLASRGFSRFRACATFVV